MMMAPGAEDLLVSIGYVGYVGYVMHNMRRASLPPFTILRPLCQSFHGCLQS
jgi:hypothetical protein